MSTHMDVGPACSAEEELAVMKSASTQEVDEPRKPTYTLGRHFHKDYPKVVGGKDIYLFTNDGREILDATSGVGVSCLGHGNSFVIKAIEQQLDSGLPYLASCFFSNPLVDDLCEELIKGTGGLMSKVYLTGSGSEAMEAALKLARQYYYDQDANTRRVSFIAREGSYHGNTLGALSVSGHIARRKPYEPYLTQKIHHVSACNAYRQRQPGHTDAQFVAGKALELESKFVELGPETVVAFVAEPIVGAALGCMPYVPGYLEAMRAVCHKYGALLILDEVMCGMGRTGTLHAWQAEGVVPDIQTIGKGLAGGYLAVSAVFASEKVVKVIREGSGQFIHGLTFQAMPVQAAAALAVQRVIREDGLLGHVRTQGEYMGELLKKKLGNHPNVRDVRGRGLFWGLEFVQDTASKEPFPLEMSVAQKIHHEAVNVHNMTTYPGTGTKDGIVGDHLILSPPFIVTKADIEKIVDILTTAVHNVFATLQDI